MNLPVEHYDTSYEVAGNVLDHENKAAYTSNLFAHERRGLEAVMDFEGRSPLQVGIGLQKGSELEGILNYHILDMLQSGLVRKMFQKWILKKPRDNSLRIFVEEAEVIELESLYFPASFLGLGIVIGCLQALAEKLHKINWLRQKTT